MGKQKDSDKPDARKRVWGKKDKNLNITLTEEGWRLAKERATKLGISVSEVVERWARNYDVNFGEAQEIPPSLDSRASVVNSMSATELTDALREKLELQQEQEEAKNKFLKKLANNSLSEADAAELAGLLDWDDPQAEGLMEVAKLLKKGKKPNGV